MRRHRSIALILSVLLPAAVGAGGCGGPEQVTAAELVQKGDAICREEQSKFSEIQRTPVVNASDGADQAQELRAVAQDSIDSLRDLKPPEPQRGPYGRYLDAKQEALQYFDQGKDAADNRDGRAYAAAVAAVSSGAPQRAKLARALGFKVCSQGPASGFAAG